MHVSVAPPVVMFAQSVDRQLSLKPDGTKFSHAHAHAHHPSAGSRGIGAFLGYVPTVPRRWPGFLQQVCVQMHN